MPASATMIRLPAAPILDMIDRRRIDHPKLSTREVDGFFTQEFGVTYRCYLRMKTTGRCTVTVADRVLTRLGHHINNIYPELLEYQ